MERYECPTCCYATNSYTKFLAHGKEHSLEKTAKIDTISKVYVVSVSYEHYNQQEESEGATDHILGVFSTQKKAEDCALDSEGSSIEEFILDSVKGRA